MLEFLLTEKKVVFLVKRGLLFSSAVACFLAVSLLLPLTGSLARAEDRGLAVVKVNILNARSGPGTGFDPVGQVTRGQVLEVTGRDGEWLQVRLEGGARAWVAGWLVEEKGHPLPALEVKVGLLNVREGPGTGYPLVTQVQQGTLLLDLQQEGDWYRVRLPGGEEGWVAGWLVSAGQGQPAGRDPSPRVPPGPIQVEPLDRGTSPGERPAPPGGPGISPPVERAAAVSVDLLNVRAGPGTGHGIISRLSRGEQVAILGQVYQWYQVRLPDNREGWVAGWLVELTSPPGDKAPETGPGTPPGPREENRGQPGEEKEGGREGEAAPPPYSLASVNAGPLNVRSGPGLDYARLFQVPLGSPLRVLTGSEQWYQVLAENQLTGWVYGLYLDLTGETAPPGDPAQGPPPPPAPDKPLAGKTIVIDPGHGGSQPGARGVTGLLEKGVTLQVSQALYDLLKEAGALPVMTREQDLYICLDSRVQLAEIKGADIFVSIHANASNNPQVSGTETYYFRHKARGIESGYLASLVQDQLVRELGRRDRGVKHGNFLVIRETSMPAILVELAFLTNPEEESLLRDPDFLEKGAQAIFRGILQYFS